MVERSETTRSDLGACGAVIGRGGGAGTAPYGRYMGVNRGYMGNIEGVEDPPLWRISGAKVAPCDAKRGGSIPPSIPHKYPL